MEIYRDVNGFEGLYQISNLGNIKNIKANKILKAKKNKGYLCITLHNNKYQRTVFIHRLVALAFIDNPENKPEINHKDENKLNNSVDNLMWCTSKENANWGTRNKRISEYVKSHPVKCTKKVNMIDLITGKLIKQYNSISDASKETKTHQGNISECCANKRNKANGFKWQFADETAF